MYLFDRRKVTRRVAKVAEPSAAGEAGDRRCDDRRSGIYRSNVIMQKLECPLFGEAVKIRVSKVVYVLDGRHFTWHAKVRMGECIGFLGGSGEMDADKDDPRKFVTLAVIEKLQEWASAMRGKD